MPISKIFVRLEYYYKVYEKYKSYECFARFNFETKHIPKSTYFKMRKLNQNCDFKSLFANNI